jgi:dTDP-4-dehydrorhamnose 3,5-epimerase
MKRFEPPSRSLIEGVRTKALKVVADERGRLMEMLRADDDLFLKFGQMYVTAAYPGVVKAWHYHERQTDHFVCVRGMMKVVLYDERAASPTKGKVNEFFIGDHNPLLVQIPPLVFHGFKCISEREALVVNLATEVYDHQHPDEFRVDAHDPRIPYDWSRQDG